MEKGKKRVSFSVAKKRVVRKRLLRQFAPVALGLALASGFFAWAIGEGRRTRERVRIQQKEWAEKEREYKRIRDEEKFREKENERELDRLLLEKVEKEEREVSEMLKKGFIPRYWIDPKTGRQMMDYLRGEGNNLVSTNSPALSPQKGTNAIEKSTEEFKQKPPSQPLPPPEEPRSAVIARNIQNNAVRARALRFARARKKNLYSGTRVLRARRGR